MAKNKGPSIAGLLREVRQSRGDSVRGAARELGVDPAYLSRVERGEQPVSRSLVQRASDYYELDSDVMALAAGRVPEDVVLILIQHPELLDQLRSTYAS